MHATDTKLLRQESLVNPYAKPRTRKAWAKIYSRRYNIDVQNKLLTLFFLHITFYFTCLVLCGCLQYYDHQHSPLI